MPADNRRKLQRWWNQALFIDDRRHKEAKSCILGCLLVVTLERRLSFGRLCNIGTGSVLGGDGQTR